MRDSARSLARRAAAALCLLVASLTLAGPVEAQSRPLAEPPATVSFLERIDLTMSAAALANNDPRFSWVADWGGEVDLVDYVWGRLTFLAEYETVLGDELQPFDPNQGIYTLAVSSSFRAGGTEFVTAFHHVSRHLGDRAKDFGIAWNAVHGRVLRRVSLGADADVELRGEAGKVVNIAFVDYAWVAMADVTLRRTVSPRVSLYGTGYGEVYGVDRAVSDRPSQRGGRVEGGVRLSGRGGALDLFVGYERVIDGDPTDRLPRQWAFAGFRFLGP